MKGLCIAIVVVVALVGVMRVAEASQRVPIAIRTEEDGSPASGATRWEKGPSVGVASVQAVMTAAGVNAVQRALTPQWANYLISTLDLAPITGEEDINILGLTVKIGYTVANISIRNVTFDQGAARSPPRDMFNRLDAFVALKTRSVCSTQTRCPLCRAAG